MDNYRDCGLFAIAFATEICRECSSKHRCVMPDVGGWGFEGGLTPYHPSSNGLAERAVRVVKEGLKKQNTSDTLTDQLSRVLLSYRITPQSTTRITPAELLFGRNLRSKLDVLKPSADKKR